MSQPELLTVDDLRRRPTITVREYAAFIGVSKDTAYEAAQRGELRVLHLGTPGARADGAGARVARAARLGPTSEHAE